MRKDKNPAKESEILEMADKSTNKKAKKIQKNKNKVITLADSKLKKENCRCKKIAKELREEKEKNRLLSEIEFDGVAIIQDGTIIYGNDILLKVSGYSLDEIRKIDIRKHLIPEHDGLYRKYYVGKKEGAYFADLVIKSGEIIKTEIVAKNILYKGKSARCLSIRDISERLKMEQALKESEAKYKLMLDLAFEGIVIFQDGKIIETNMAAFKKSEASTNEELVGKEIWDYLTPRSKEETKRHINENSEEPYIATFVRRDNSTFEGEVKIRNGEYNGTKIKVACIRDVTDRVIQEKQLEKAKYEANTANDAKSRFLANMSHELRTPLNSIIGMTEAMKYESNMTQGEKLELISSSAETLLKIINDILDFSRIESGNMKLINIEFDIRDIIRKSVDLFWLKKKDNVDLTYYISPEIPMKIMGDPDKFQQVLVNIIGNSVKFTERGYISVNVKENFRIEEKMFIQISVEDTGIGIPENKINDIFKNFMQIDESYSRKYEGTGLGLTISKELVELMGGRINVKSKLGKGALFVINIPFTAKKEYALPALHKANIILIENNRATVNNIINICRDFNLQITLCDSAEDAVDILKDMKKIKEDFLVLINPVFLIPDGELYKYICLDESLMPKIVIMQERSARNTHEFDKFYRDVLKPVDHNKLYEILTDKNNSHKNQKNTSDFKVLDVNSKNRESLFSGYKLLVIEDNAANIKTMKELLGIIKIESDFAKDGTEALSIIEENQYDMILMDIQLPGQNGFELTKLIRKHEKYNNIPIIALTAHAIKGYKKKCIDNGMTDYILKPVKIKELSGVFSKYLKGIEIDAEETEREFKEKEVQKRIRKEVFVNWETEREKIKAAIIEKNYDIIEKIVHSCKSGWGVIGEEEIYEILSKVEECSRADLAEEAEELFTAADSLIMKGGIGDENINN